MNRKGIFITLEGGDGSGKTTMIQRLAKYMEEEGHPVVTTREPGGIEISEKIRSIILDPAHTSMDARTEALLYAAARRQHLVEKVKPAIEQGAMVLCDRFVDSSLVYQGFARGIGIEEVASINRFAVDDWEPDATFYLDIEPELGLARINASRGEEMDRLDMESISFHHKVREAYLELARKFPERITIVDASPAPEQVEQVLKDLLKKRFIQNFSV
ncbi:dTMP kinase [Paenibacillus sp. P2(2022)]|uniref:dTMP kinase n=1 Tax=Paenibacillus TaxID=44249 RepID=UPI0005ECABF5|nr:MULTISPECIES: dTMP kinase [Paenibacillus]AUS24276.1 thymidylate kinase [Paenibacillus polymyxa]KJK28618.1 thymidylate kinase [Paenibacillus polymyxa]MDG0056496.1 dTMP kinase [Paenibacillus sp. P2(2022)]